MCERKEENQRREREREIRVRQGIGNDTDCGRNSKKVRQQQREAQI